MKDNYYTPDIEDLRVGYECEIRNNASANDHWIKGILDTNFFLISLKLNNWIENIRTTYLTKKQIESLKWRYIDKDVFANFINERDKKKYDTLIFKKKDMELLWIEELNMINIGTRDDMGYINSRYIGECKDINTLKYLQKLLNIKL